MMNDASDEITTSNTTISFCGVSHKSSVFIEYEGKRVSHRQPWGSNPQPSGRVYAVPSAIEARCATIAPGCP
jgi:hypothetical protein